MPRNTLSKEHKKKLEELWNGGMTSTVKKDKIAEAVASTGLEETRVKVCNSFKMFSYCIRPQNEVLSSSFLFFYFLFFTSLFPFGDEMQHILYVTLFNDIVEFHMLLSLIHFPQHCN